MRTVLFDTNFWGPWVMSRAGGTWYGGGQAFGVMDLESKRPLGGVCYDLYTGNAIHVHFAGDDKRFITKELLWCTFDYPFNQLGAKKLIGPIRESNEVALKINKRLGFWEEARLQNIYVDGEDLLFMVITKDKAQRWLDLKTKINPEHLVHVA